MSRSSAGSHVAVLRAGRQPDRVDITRTAALPMMTTRRSASRSSRCLALRALPAGPRPAVTRARGTGWRTTRRCRSSVTLPFQRTIVLRGSRPGGLTCHQGASSPRKRVPTSATRRDDLARFTSAPGKTDACGDLGGLASPTRRWVVGPHTTHPGVSTGELLDSMRPRTTSSRETCGSFRSTQEGEVCTSVADVMAEGGTNNRCTVCLMSSHRITLPSRARPPGCPQFHDTDLRATGLHCA